MERLLFSNEQRRTMALLLSAVLAGCARPEEIASPPINPPTYQPTQTPTVITTATSEPTATFTPTGIPIIPGGIRLGNGGVLSVLSSELIDFSEVNLGPLIKWGEGRAPSTLVAVCDVISVDGEDRNVDQEAYRCVVSESGEEVAAIFLPPIRPDFDVVVSDIDPEYAEYLRRILYVSSSYAINDEFNQLLAISILDFAEMLGLDISGRDGNFFEPAWNNTVYSPDYRITTCSSLACYYTERDQIEVNNLSRKALPHELMHLLLDLKSGQQEVQVQAVERGDKSYVLLGKNGRDLVSIELIRGEYNEFDRNVKATRLEFFEEILADIVSSLNIAIQAARMSSSESGMNLDEDNESSMGKSAYLYWYFLNGGTDKSRHAEVSSDFVLLVEFLHEDEAARDEFFEYMVFDPDYIKAISLIGRLLNSVFSDQNGTDDFLRGYKFLSDANALVFEQYHSTFPELSMEASILLPAHDTYNNLEEFVKQLKFLNGVN